MISPPTPQTLKESLTLIRYYSHITPLNLNTHITFLIWSSCKANARVKLAKSGHGPRHFRIVICVVLVIVLCYCLYAVLLLLCCTVIVLLCYYLCHPMYLSCVLYHCHRVLTQLQSTNISIYKVLSKKQHPPSPLGQGHLFHEVSRSHKSTHHTR